MIKRDLVLKSEKNNQKAIMHSQNYKLVSLATKKKEQVSI
jgi:hypothetical protein